MQFAENFHQNKPEPIQFDTDGAIPNSRLPLLVYRNAVPPDAAAIEALFAANRWPPAWRDGVHPFHHFHSTAHEVLVALNGSARVQFGGPNGITLNFEKGDVVIIPAGVAHCKIDGTNGFTCLGAYPEGQKYDMNYGRPGERPGVDKNIKAVPLPENDPLYGTDGPLVKNWLSEADQNKDVL